MASSSSLQVSPDHEIEFCLDRSIVAHAVATTKLTVRNPMVKGQQQKAIAFHVLSSTDAGLYIFSPCQGVLLPGQNQDVEVFLTNEHRLNLLCQTEADGNTVDSSGDEIHVAWSHISEHDAAHPEFFTHSNTNPTMVVQAISPTHQHHFLSARLIVLGVAIHIDTDAEDTSETNLQDSSSASSWLHIVPNDDLVHQSPQMQPMAALTVRNPLSSESPVHFKMMTMTNQPRPALCIPNSGVVLPGQSRRIEVRPVDGLQRNLLAQAKKDKTFAHTRFELELVWWWSADALLTTSVPDAFEHGVDRRHRIFSVNVCATNEEGASSSYSTSSVLHDSLIRVALGDVSGPPLACEAPASPLLCELLLSDLPEGMVFKGEKAILLQRPGITPGLTREQLRFRMDVYQFLSGRPLQEEFSSKKTICHLKYRCCNADCPFRLVYRFVHVQHSPAYDTDFGITEYKSHECLPTGATHPGTTPFPPAHHDPILTLQLSSALVAYHCLQQESVPMEGTEKETKDAIMAQVLDELCLSLSPDRAYTGYRFFEHLHLQRRNTAGSLPSLENLWARRFSRTRWREVRLFGFPRWHTQDSCGVKMCKYVWCVVWAPIFVIALYVASFVWWIPFLILAGPVNMSYAETGIPRERQLMEEYEREGAPVVGSIFSKTLGTFDVAYQVPGEVDASGCRPWFTKHCFSHNMPSRDSIPVLVIPGKPSSGYPAYLIDSSAAKYSSKAIWCRWVSGLVGSAMVGAGLAVGVASATVGAVVDGAASLAGGWRVMVAVGVLLLVLDVLVYHHFKKRSPSDVENKIVDGARDPFCRRLVP